MKEEWGKCSINLIKQLSYSRYCIFDTKHKLTTDHLQKKIDDITKLTRTQQQKLDSLDHKMADIEKKIEMKLQDSEKRNSLTISHLQKQINDMKELGPSIVTFLALLISPTYGSIAVQATVKFQKTIENIGSGYNTETGIFTAPTKGLYHFTASARQSQSGYLHFGLFRNNEQMSVSVAANFISLTIGATFTLQSGDRVYVKNVWDKPSDIVGVGQTYFSGSLVHKM
ncbi:C1QL [Mytilus edulis]|uniref:C1QL n=1 Tax=Mytilus edulis TaxID=6550 RepID=A0A8S3SL60_MYTED|nr:C1QL [Mytilus edulis]